MGAVWRVHDLRLDRVVALKQLRRLDPEQTERFRREAQTLAALQDPHIVQVLDHGEAGDQMYLVMELVEGRPFDRLPPEVHPLAGWQQVGEALQTVHDHGIVHRDVKPANAILDRHGRAVLLDFGLIHDPNQGTLTKTGHVVGSLAYLAPELLQGGPATPRADWYSWGVSLFQLLEGRLPFDNDAVLAFLEGRGRPNPSYEKLGPSHRLRPALELLLQVDPRDRPGRWSEVLDLLQDPEEASLQLASTPTRDDLQPSPLLAHHSPATGRLPRGPLVLATALGLALTGWIGWGHRASPPAPADAPREAPGALPGEDPVPPEARQAWKNVAAMFPRSWSDLARREDPGLDHAEVDAFVDAALDPRVPLAYQRYLDELLSWLDELGAGGVHLGSVLRRPEYVQPSRHLLLDNLLYPLIQVRGPRGWYERQLEVRPGVGRRLLRLNEIDQDLSARLASFLLELERRREHLPPLLVAAAVLAHPLPALRESGRDPRPTILVMAREVPEDTPYAREVAQAAVRYVGHQQPESAVGSSGSEGLALCAANIESARQISEICQRLVVRLGAWGQMMVLGDAAYTLNRCIQGCPPAFQDRVTNAHLVIARMLGELLEAHPGEDLGVERRRDELARTFLRLGVWGDHLLKPPAAPPR